MLIPITSTEHWHELRAKNIGGSDVAQLWNEGYGSKYKLWHVKAGLLPPDDLDDNERVQAGNYMEPAIIAWANDKWKTDFEKAGVYAVHDTVKGMGATPDAFSASNKAVIAQLKNVDGLQFASKWSYEGDTITDAPLHILLQCQHEMACTGAALCVLIVLVGGNRLFRMQIARRDKTIRMIENEIGHPITGFWASIKSGIAPPPDYKLDGDTIATLNAIATAGKVIDLTGNNRISSLVSEYAEAKLCEREGKKAADAAKAEILHLCGDAEYVTCGDLTFRVSQTKATPDKTITIEMVGQKMNGRAGSRRIILPKDNNQQENEDV